MEGLGAIGGGFGKVGEGIVTMGGEGWDAACKWGAGVASKAKGAWDNVCKTAGEVTKAMYDGYQQARDDFAIEMAGVGSVLSGWGKDIAEDWKSFTGRASERYNEGKSSKAASLDRDLPEYQKSSSAEKAKDGPGLGD